MFQNKNPWKLKTTMKMDEKCSVCGQPYNIEVGFYYGTGYVSYAISIALSVATFFAWWLIIGFSLNDNRVFYWFGFNAIFLIVIQPYLMRLSRTLWLAFFVSYDNDWKNNPTLQTERTNKDQENNW
jgi:hypothetical protein